DVHNFSSWDFGLLSRPFSWLSVGGAALDATRQNGLPRRWQLSLGLRPLGEVTEIAGDVRWSECTNATGLCGIDNYDLLITLRTRFLRGVHFLGQVARLGGGNLPTSFLFGLQLDT